LTADAGYGSEENYLLLAKRKIQAYVKHTQFDREQHGKQTDWFKNENLEYDKKKDIVYCPIGEPMKRIGMSTTQNSQWVYSKINNVSGFQMQWMPNSRCMS
jgi:hypothetical protein